ncbi:unnamed protein product [Brassica rapa subsp. trilocularis]
MNVTLMGYFPILELPEEIQALVVERVAGNSFPDLYGLRALCMSMKALAERSREYFARFTRESVDRIGKLVRSLKWAWGLSHSDEFLAKWDEFISTVVPSFYSCQCVPIMGRDWVLWYIEKYKGDKMCNLCFWIKELGLFFREFEPMSVIMDTREW